MSSLPGHSTDFFRRVFHASPVSVGICTLNEGRFVEVNESFLELIGFERQETIGRTDLELGLWAEDKEREEVCKRLATNETLRDIEWRIRTKGGELRTALASAELIEVQGAPCVLFIVHDLTDRLNREVQVRQAQKMEAVGQLAAGFAHDFNNILAIVQGYTSLLLAETDLDQQTNKALREVSTAAERAANLTRRLLAFSRKQVMQPKTLDLNQVLDGLDNMLQQLLGQQIELKFEREDEALLVKADRSMMEQMITNLAANARDAMPQGGRFSIETSVLDLSEEDVRATPNARTGLFACVRVSDTGCGMSPATMNRIFEPFFTTKEVGKGTGLSLSTVYGIVKQHNGWIQVSSQLGHGTIFKIFLPAETPTIESATPKSAAAGKAQGKERILVVEDEDVLRVMVEAILQRHDYVVLGACNGVEALRIWGQCRGEIDLLLTDMVLPEGMTGRQLAEQLKAQKAGLKVIYTSGYSVDLISDQTQTLSEGLNFLQKPYHPQFLAETVRACLDSAPTKPKEALALETK